jgi:hypothetical protein
MIWAGAPDQRTDCRLGSWALSQRSILLSALETASSSGMEESRSELARKIPREPLQGPAFAAPGRLNLGDRRRGAGKDPPLGLRRRGTASQAQPGFLRRNWTCQVNTSPTRGSFEKLIGIQRVD